MQSQRQKQFHKLKPYIGVIFLQTGFAGMDVLSKAALNEGMSNYVLVVYRHFVAFVVIAPFAVILDKKVRPKMTYSIFLKLVALSILEPVIDQNLYFMGMKYTTATFAAAMTNILPAITFVMAWMLRIEKMKMRSTHSQAKLIGTIATVGGAMVMTLIKGPAFQLFHTQGSADQQQHSGGINLQSSVKGAAMITVGCFCWACFMILQATTLKQYPAELSLTAWICLLGTMEGTLVGLVMERGNASVWSLHWDTKLIAALYSGIVCSGLAYYVQGVVMQERGPVFVTAFSPLCMVIVAIMGSFILAEQISIGRVIGAVIIVAGLYLVVWGKSIDYSPRIPPLEDETLKAKQITDANSSNENLNVEIITVSPLHLAEKNRTQDCLAFEETKPNAN